MKRLIHQRKYIAALVFSALLVAQCGDKIIILGQVGAGLADSIGRMQVLTKQLVDAKVLPPKAAISIQEDLIKLNDALRPVPQILRDLDKMRETNAVDIKVVETAVQVLELVAKQLPEILKGIPVTEVTSKLITLINEARNTTNTILLELAKLKGTT